MTDFQLLYVVLAVIYLSDCFFWVRRGSIVLRRLWAFSAAPARRTARGVAIIQPSSGFASTTSGFVPLNPLPPFGYGFVVSQWPLSMNQQGVCSFVPTVFNGHDRPEQLGYYVRFSDIATVSRDSVHLLVNGRRFATLNSEAAAHYFSRLLVRLAALPAEKRDVAIGAALRRATSVPRIQRRLRRFRGFAAPLKFNAWFVALALFGLVPVTIASLDYRRFLLSALVLLVGLLVINAGTYLQAQRRLFPGLFMAGLRSAFTMIFTSPASIRAADTLARDLLAAFDPVAAGLLLAAPAQRQHFARTLWRDLNYPMQPALPPSAGAEERAAVEQFATRYRQVIRSLLMDPQLAPAPIDSLLAPPPASDPTCRSYCPRCEMQFVLTTGVCSHCGDLALQALATSPAEEGSGAAERRAVEKCATFL